MSRKEWAWSGPPPKTATPTVRIRYLRDAFVADTMELIKSAMTRQAAALDVTEGALELSVCALLRTHEQLVLEPYAASRARAQAAKAKNFRRKT